MRTKITAKENPWNGNYGAAGLGFRMGARGTGIPFCPVPGLCRWKTGSGKVETAHDQPESQPLDYPAGLEDGSALWIIGGVPAPLYRAGTSPGRSFD